MIQIDIPMPKGCHSCPCFRKDSSNTRCVAKSRIGRQIDDMMELDYARMLWCPIERVSNQLT